MSMRKTKGERLEGRFEVLSVRSVIVGCTPWETPCLKLRHVETGRTVYWVSETINEKGLFDLSLRGLWLDLVAFVRPYGNGSQENLYRVRVKDAPENLSYYHRLNAGRSE